MPVMDELSALKGCQCMSGTCHLLPGIHSGPSLMRVWAGWFVGWCSFAGRVLDFRLVVSAMCTVMVEACRIEDIA